MSKVQHSIKLVGYDSIDLFRLSYSNGDVVYDVTTGTLRVMDGATPGGSPLLRSDLSNLSGLISVKVSDVQPSATTSGTLWFNSSNGGLYVYYKDNSGSHWLQANTPAFGSGSGGGSSYSLPAATTSTLGGVTIPAVATSGIINSSGTIRLATAGTTQIGGVTIDGVTLAFNNSGQLYATGAGIGGYVLPTATTNTLGGVKVDGTSITINNGVISGASTYTLPIASTSVVGGIKVDGSTITISNGIIQANYTSYVLPTATTNTLGGVKVDGSTITVNNGVISATTQSLTYGARTTIQTTTASIANGVAVTATLGGVGKAYMLYSITATAGAWVVVYSSSTTMISDSSRTITTDPTPGSGVHAEAITTTSGTTYFTPAVLAYNNDSSITTNTYLKIYKNSGSTAAITVTLTYLRLE